MICPVLNYNLNKQKRLKFKLYILELNVLVSARIGFMIDNLWEYLQISIWSLCEIIRINTKFGQTTCF